MIDVYFLCILLSLAFIAGVLIGAYLSPELSIEEMKEIIIEYGVNKKMKEIVSKELEKEISDELVKQMG